MAKEIGELVQFRIVEKDVFVDKPIYVEKEVEVPKYVEVEFEKPVIKEVTYEKPVIVMNDITEEIKQLIMKEVKRAIEETIATLKFSIDLPMPRIVQMGRK